MMTKKIKDAVIRYRSTQEEKVGFEQAAEKAGLSLSSWIRTRLRAASIAELGESSPFATRPREMADSLAS
jgi:hypothetical protein